MEDCAGPKMKCGAIDPHHQDPNTTLWLDCGPLPKAVQLRCPAAVDRLKKCTGRRASEMAAAMERRGIHVDKGCFTS